MTAGWFGLIGVSVGAAGALLGGWYQQRWQAKEARIQRREDRAHAAGETALNSLLLVLQNISALRASLREPGAAHPPNNEWIVESLNHLQAVEVATWQIPGPEKLRYRIHIAIQNANNYGTAEIPQGEIPAAVHMDWIKLAAQEALACMSAFIRNEALPPHYNEFAQQMEHSQRIQRSWRHPS